MAGLGELGCCLPAMEVAPDKLLQVCESLLPSGVAPQYLRERDQASELFDHERLQVANFAEKRRQEFRAGRCCARRALAELGVEACAIPSGPDRAPDWPDGIVGSISHCEDHAVAVVARQDACRGIGVDLEARDRVGADVWSQIATGSERDALARLSVSASREQATRLGDETMVQHRQTYEAAFKEEALNVLRDTGAQLDRSPRTWESAPGRCGDGFVRT